MRNLRDRGRKAKEVSLQRSRAVLTLERRSITSSFANNRQNEKYQSFSTGLRSHSKKWKMEVLETSSSKDDSDRSPAKRKKRKLENIIQDSENQRRPSNRGVDSHSVMCHQCQRTGRMVNRVVNCTMCRQKRFCVACITNWYPLLSEEEIAERCPVCRGYCNCISCLRKKKPPRKKIHTADEVKHAWHVVQHLYPWLREFHEQQNAEKRREAETKGIEASDLVIPKAKYKSERICCCTCKAYIVDFHWSCRNCACVLCLPCCQELLEQDAPTTSEALPHGSDQQDPDSDDYVCETPVPELKSLLGESFISKLYEEVSEMVANNPYLEESEGDIRKCSCLTKSNREVNLFCPMAREVKEGHYGHFGWHWVKGEPVIVRDVLELSSGLSWEPMVMWRALRQKRSNGQLKLSMLAQDCRDWSDVKISMQFFKGYQEGLSNKDGGPLLLRMKDSSFAERSPRHEEEVMSVLPFPEYTDPLCGPLNLAAQIPTNNQRLGLTIDIAYGVQEELGEGDSVTKLHYDSYDVVNILMHNKEVRLTAKQRAVLRKPNRKGYKIQKMRSSDHYGGSLWDIWRREDVPKLKGYLTEHARDFTNHCNPPLSSVDDLIRCESVYFTTEHKIRLKNEYGVEAWTFEQKLGDAVFVPAGCPYQVRNLKSCINVTLGFVSLESFRVCIGLSDELRLKSSAKEDKLEVEKMAVYALEKAMSRLRLEMLERRNEQIVESKDNEGDDGDMISDPDFIAKPDNNCEIINIPDPEFHYFDSKPDSGNEPDKIRVAMDVHDLKFCNFDGDSGQLKQSNLETGYLINAKSDDSCGDLGPQKEPDNNMMTMGASAVTFHDLVSYLVESEFHNFEGDWTEKSFKPNQVWAIYSDDDGMPKFYALIQKVVSLSPFEARMAFLKSHTDSEFGDIKCLPRGLDKACGEFRLCQPETSTNRLMFSHQVKWEKGQNGVIKIFPQKGDVWALYRNWSPDWDENTPDEALYEYDMVEILEECNEKNVISAVPLVKVNGFNVVFRKDPDQSRVKQFPRKEMSRFCHHVPSYRLTDDDVDAKGEKLAGYVELDPAATPLEWARGG